MSVLQGIEYFLPETVLTGFVLLLILVDLLPYVRKGVLPYVALLGITGAFVMLFYPYSPLTVHRSPVLIFSGMLAYDHFSVYFKVAFFAAAFMVVLFSMPVTRKWTERFPAAHAPHAGVGEYYALVLSCTLGMCLMASARNILMMYLALEFVSVTSYIMAGLIRHNRKSAEASLKYIIYGAAASGMMLYGLSYLYGLTGVTDVGQIGQIVAHLAKAGAVSPAFILLTSVLVMAGFAYKIAAVPFHMWCPDVYEGAPTPITAFFSVGPKAAGFAMLIRFLLGVFPQTTPTGEAATGGFEWQLVLGVMCVLTMALGNFAALQQNNLKRLMAYSSIAHAGYMLLAFSIFTPDNIASVMFYIVVYLMMNLGAFFVVILLEEKFGIETVEGCRGLGWKQPALCAAMTIFLFSLTGLPPFAGFIGKLLIFGYTVKGGGFGITLVVLGVLFSVVSLYYYARIVMAMFLQQKAEGASAPPAPSLSLWEHILVWLLALPTALLVINWEPLFHFAQSASRQILSR